MRDVARLAGVSPMTVSNVFNDVPNVSPATRDRVLQAMEELRYRVNVSARNLRSGRSGVIALALPEIDNAYFAELAHSVVAAAARRSLTVLIDETAGDRERESAAVTGFGTSLIDGLIFVPRALGTADLAGRDESMPLVLLGETAPVLTVDGIGIDSVDAGRRATAHLVDLGRRRVAAIGSTGGSDHVGSLRLDGYRAALADAGLAADPALVQPAEEYTEAVGLAAMAALLALPDPPDAVFCFSDRLALGALRALHLARRSVPGDVAVIGVDDIDAGRYSSPSLSTISPDKAFIAETAVEMLLDRKEPPDAPRHVVAPAALVARESTLGTQGPG